jgi:GGDEF domain-containing protein
MHVKKLSVNRAFTLGTLGSWLIEAVRRCLRQDDSLGAKRIQGEPFTVLADHGLKEDAPELRPEVR